MRNDFEQFCFGVETRYLAALSLLAFGYTTDRLGSLLARQTGAGFAARRDALAMAHVRAET
jgi:hypothetical protein